MLLLYQILLPFVVGLILLLYPKREFPSYKNPVYLLSLLTGLLNFVISIAVIKLNELYFNLPIIPKGAWLGPELSLNLIANKFSALFLLGLSFFGLLVISFSYIYKTKIYFILLLWTLSASSLAVLADNLFIMFLAWGIVAVLLYFLILQGGPNATTAAYKTLVMVAGSDALMLVGAGILFYLTKTLNMSEIALIPHGPLEILAFVLLLIGALTKAGAVPFHTWIPDTAEVALVGVMALMPAAFDKLLGIYLLTRLTHDLFHIAPASGLSILVMAIGALTVIIGVSMALVQKELIKLLSYHAVSQVGYMVLGLGTALPIGVVGALFHMFNNTIYKTCLFFCGGAVGYRTGTTKLEKLGGLISYMPLTFLAALISSLAISGIPPLNGYASKWLIYQGEILVANINNLNIAFLVLAMFGSVLTLASFLKVLHSVFLGSKPAELTEIKETGIGMTIPMLILSGLCIFLGLYPSVMIDYLSQAIYGVKLAYPGIYQPGLLAVLIIIGVILGFVIFIATRLIRPRESEPFIGGEVLAETPKSIVSFKDTEAIVKPVHPNEVHYPGSYFYDGLKKISLVNETYELANKKYFDLYEELKKLTFKLISGLRTIHTGLLQSYLGWLFLGGLAIIVTFLIALFK
ncbi:MAG: proton-conducting transporter membrane subunit [candidate division WOR-3 bacterium]